MAKTFKDQKKRDIRKAETSSQKRKPKMAPYKRSTKNRDE